MFLDATRTQGTLVPRSALAQRTRYTAQLTAAVADQSDNHLAPLTWGFFPVDLHARVRAVGLRRQRGARGVKLLVRSTDSETLTLTLRALAPGRRAGRAKKLGSARARARREAAAVARRQGRAGRGPPPAGEGVGRGEGPGGKRKTRTRTVSVRP